MQGKIIIFILSLILLAQPAMAFEKLFAKHCKGTKAPKEVALAIAKHESGMNPLCINVAGKDYSPKNKEEAIKIIRQAQEEKKSYDVGLMQINCQWLSRFKIDPVELLNPDTNIRIGVQLLDEEIQRHGLNWRAIGKYHSPNPARGINYAGMVSRQIKGNAELKSMLANPRLQRAAFFRRYMLKDLRALNLLNSGKLGSSHIQRRPIGFGSRNFR